MPSDPPDAHGACRLDALRLLLPRLKKPETFHGRTRDMGSVLFPVSHKRGPGCLCASRCVAQNFTPSPTCGVTGTEEGHQHPGSGHQISSRADKTALSGGPITGLTPASYTTCHPAHSPPASHLGSWIPNLAFVPVPG